MIMKELKNNVAYRCPHCGVTVSGIINIFLFAGAKHMIKLKCNCSDESALTITETSDNKLNISVPCLPCGGSHSFKISKEMFFKKDNFTMRCPYSGIEIFFLGTEENIEKHLKDSEQDLVSLFESVGMEDATAIFEKNSDSDTDYTEHFIDRHMQDIITFIIEELAADHKIHCHCPDEHGEYVITNHDRTLRVSCKKCGAKCDISVDNSIATNAIIHSDSLTLK